MLEHRLAKTVAFATFLLLIIGGAVNATGSGLACREPTFVCNGHFFPKMTGGVFYEHGHRLAAQTVGLLQIFLTIFLIRRRPDLKALAWILGGLVLLQATLGAVTVAFKLPWYVSTGHLCVAMTYFATLIYTVFRTRPEPSVTELAMHDKRRAELGTTRKLIGIALIAIMIQILLGALVRHLHASLACVGMPTCNLQGTWWPAAHIQQLHMVHRGWGCVTAIVTTVVAIQVLRKARSWPALRMMMLIAPVLIAGQIALGVLVVHTMRLPYVAVLHFAGAASVWTLWLSAWFSTAERSPARVASLPKPAFLPVPVGIA